MFNHDFLIWLLYSRSPPCRDFLLALKSRSSISYTVATINPWYFFLLLWLPPPNAHISLFKWILPWPLPKVSLPSAASMLRSAYTISCLWYSCGAYTNKLGSGNCLCTTSDKYFPGSWCKPLTYQHLLLQLLERPVEWDLSVEVTHPEMRRIIKCRDKRLYPVYFRAFSKLSPRFG